MKTSTSNVIAKTLIFTFFVSSYCSIIAIGNKELVSFFLAIDLIVGLIFFIMLWLTPKYEYKHPLEPERKCEPIENKSIPSPKAAIYNQFNYDNDLTQTKNIE